MLRLRIWVLSLLPQGSKAGVIPTLALTMPQGSGPLRDSSDDSLFLDTLPAAPALPQRRGDHTDARSPGPGAWEGLGEGPVPTGDPAPSPTEAGRGWVGGGRKARLGSSSETQNVKEGFRGPSLLPRRLRTWAGLCSPQFWDKRTVTKLPARGRAPWGHSRSSRDLSTS